VVSVTTYRDAGFLPEDFVNFLCLLGWSPKDNREKLPIEEVIRIFELGKINRKGAVFDLEKCAWLNGEYARELPDERFFPLAIDALKRAGLPLEHFPESYTKAALETCKGKFRLFTELPAYCGFYFTDQVDFNPEGVAKHFIPENKPRLAAVRDAFAALDTFDAANLETTLKATAATLGVKVGLLVHPTRLAVTGSNAGPSLYHLLEILGKEKVLARIDRALGQPAFQ